MLFEILYPDTCGAIITKALEKGKFIMLLASGKEKINICSNDRSLRKMFRTILQMILSFSNGSSVKTNFLSCQWCK